MCTSLCHANVLHVLLTNNALSFMSGEQVKPKAISLMNRSLLLERSLHRKEDIKCLIDCGGGKAFSYTFHRAAQV